MNAKLLVATGSVLVFVTLAWSQPEQRIDSIQGPVLYKAYCAVCHGADAKGNGPMAASLRIAPPDLTRYAARHRGAYSRADMRRVILGQVSGGQVSGGQGTSGSHGTSDMPIWGPVFSDVGLDDRDMGQVRADNLVRYLETLQRN